jgi:Arc/MetJ-type ribon-helix-helix transcriptional regulator
MKTVTVKLTPTEYELCRQLAVFGSFLSISDVLRAALVELGRARKVKTSTLEKMAAERNQHEPRARQNGRFPDFGTDWIALPKKR